MRKLKLTLGIALLTGTAAWAQTSATPTATPTATLTCPTSAVIGDSVHCTITVKSATSAAYTVSAAPDPANSKITVSAPSGDVSTDKTSGSADFYLVFAAPANALPDNGVSVTVSASLKGAAAGATPTTAKLTLLPAGTFTGGEIFRLVAGTTLSFPASGEPTGKLFANMYLDWGVGGKHSDATFCSGAKADDSCRFGSAWRHWLQADLMTLSSATPATPGGVSGLLTGSDTSSLSSLNAGSVQNFGLRTGLSRRIATTDLNLNGIPHGTSTTLVELIAGGGFSTPINGPAPTPQIFCLTPGSGSACTPLKGATAFPAGDTDSLLVVSTPPANGYLWNWEAGLRMQTFYGQMTDSHQPAMTDVTIGQDAAITEGRMHGPVLSLQGFWPVPGAADEFFIVFGGSVQLGGRNTLGALAPTNLNPVDNTGYTGSYLGPNFTQQAGPMVNADSYHVGIAVDVVDFFKNHFSSMFSSKSSGN